MNNFRNICGLKTFAVNTLMQCLSHEKHGFLENNLHFTPVKMNKKNARHNTKFFMLIWPVR